MFPFFLVMSYFFCFFAKDCYSSADDYTEGFVLALSCHRILYLHRVRHTPICAATH